LMIMMLDYSAAWVHRIILPGFFVFFGTFRFGSVSLFSLFCEREREWGWDWFAFL